MIDKQDPRFARSDVAALTASRRRKPTQSGRWVRAVRSPVLLALLSLTAFAIAGSEGRSAEAASAKHGIAMHGDPALSPGFERLRYVNPAAPKGGRLTNGVVG